MQSRRDMAKDWKTTTPRSRLGRTGGARTKRCLKKIPGGIATIHGEVVLRPNAIGNNCQANGVGKRHMGALKFLHRAFACYGTPRDKTLGKKREGTLEGAEVGRDSRQNTGRGYRTQAPRTEAAGATCR